MNRYFDDTDDLNEAHTGESCAQTLSGKDERKVGVACSSDSFGFSGSSSYADGDAMRRNGEQILEAISNFPTPFQHSKMNLDPNLVKGEDLSGKGDAFDHDPELPSDDEDSLESIFDEPFEPDSRRQFPQLNSRVGKDFVPPQFKHMHTHRPCRSSWVR
jgi:hypothetical protein